MSELENIKIKLTKILTRVASVKQIKNYELVVNTESSMTEGFLSDFYTGIVRNKENGHVTTVAIKLVPKKGGIFQDYVLLYNNEDNAYSKVFPALNNFQNKKKIRDPFKNIPEYFCGSTEPENEYIAMQNLTDIGYCILDKKICFSNNHLNFIFETFGKFHALSFAFKDQYLEKYNNASKNLTDIFEGITEKDPILETIENSVLSGVKVFDNDIDITTKLKNIKNVKSFVLNGLKYKGQYKCIVHGDCWSNNMLFKYKDSGQLEDMKLIDFQLTKEGTPVHDLIFFFYSGASEKDFKKLDIYLEKYYKSFSNFAKELGSDPDKLYPWNVLKDEWAESAVVFAFLSIDMLVAKLMDNKTILELRNKGGSKEEVLKLWEDEMNKVRKTDEFKYRTKNIILHLIEYGFL